MNSILEALQAEMNGTMGLMRRFYTMHLYGDGFPRCHVPYAGRCADSILDAWEDDGDTYLSPPDTACLCEGGVCRG